MTGFAGRHRFDAAAGQMNWAGYAIGYELVGRYLRARPDVTAAALVNIDAREIWRHSLDPG